MGLDGGPGLGMRAYGDALILPLAPWLHYFDGEGIDGNVGRATWEERWGEQASHIDRVSELVGYDLWELHRSWLSWKSMHNGRISNG
jgi:hypothetical protein